MATYALYTAALGAQFANDTVKIFDVATQAPAIVMLSATSGVVNTLGLATLDGSGGLSVYLDSSKTWAVNPYPTNAVVASSSNTQESTQLLVKTAVQTIATNTAGGGGGSATSANQLTEITALQSLDTKTPAKGTATSANASPVVIASDQAAVPVTVSGVATAANQATANTSLSTIATNTTGVATAANQATQITAEQAIQTSAAAINTKTPALGSAVSASASPVVIASDQAAVPVTVSGVSTAANQTTGNTSLATIAAAPVVATAVVKAASTAAVATDPALVVAISPNNPLSVGAVSDATASGSITILNSNATGTATAGSAVALTTLNGAGVVLVQVSGTWSQTLVGQISVDGTNWTNINAYAIGTAIATPASSLPNGTAAMYMYNVLGASQFRTSCSAFTSGTAVVSLRSSTASTGPLASYQSANVSVIAGISTAGLSANGAGVAGLPTGIVGSVPQTDYNAVTTWTTTSGNGTTITDNNGTGAVCSFDINISVFTTGSSTGLDLFLQWSPDAGTTWYDQYQVEAITVTGHYYIPAQYMQGSRRRIRWVNRTGTATAVTATVIANRLSIAPATIQRQWFDRTAGVLAGTASAVTPWYDVAGCRLICIWLPVGVAVGPATYQLQLSSDQVNVLPVGTATISVASTTTAYPASQGMTARYARLAVTTAATSQTAATTPIVITGV